MLEEIAEIYEYAQIFPTINEVINNCYASEELQIKANWEDIQDILGNFLDKVKTVDPELSQTAYSILQNACSFVQEGRQEFVMMADHLSLAIPFLHEAMSKLWKIDVSEGDIRLISSKSGFFSMQNVSLNKYYCSLIDPMWEACVMSKRIYSPAHLDYYFLGCGLGYLPWQVFCASDCSADIYVFHPNEYIVNYAIEYGVLGWIPKEKLHIVVETDGFVLLDKFSDTGMKKGEIGYYCMDDALDYLSPEMNSIVTQFMITNRTLTAFGNLLSTNMYRNMSNTSKTIFDYKNEDLKQDWVVIAAGPSLDDNMKYLKSIVGKKTIICVSTVFKKILKEGIRPDIVAVLDPQARTWGHFEGIDEYYDIPLFVATTANWRFGEWYNGPKYLVPLNNTTDDVVNKQINNGLQMMFLGCTVSSMAITIAAEMGARKIDLVGIDLSFPTGATHSTGTMDYSKIDTASRKMVMVPCVSGGTVMTDRVFWGYIKEIEELISKYKNIEFTNYSSAGASFKGSKWIGKR